MASAPNPREYEEIRAAIQTTKIWVLGQQIEWVANGASLPGFKFRAPLALEMAPKIQVEGLFVDGYFKDSSVPGVPSKLSLCLSYKGRRVLGIDDNGPSRHFNTVGIGLRYYHQRVDHPHVHFTVSDAYDGYAEPLQPVSRAEHWTDFMGRANIQGFPAFVEPPGQLGLI